MLGLISTPPRARCPSCSRPSGRIHSRYQRTLADLPWADWKCECANFSALTQLVIAVFAPNGCPISLTPGPGVPCDWPSPSSRWAWPWADEPGRGSRIACNGPRHRLPCCEWSNAHPCPRRPRSRPLAWMSSPGGVATAMARSWSTWNPSRRRPVTGSLGRVRRPVAGSVCGHHGREPRSQRLICTWDYSGRAPRRAGGRSLSSGRQSARGT
jgi:hypothetical protein